ncbi:hypothetical protein DYB31_004392 [Aphanomyces astaci]|uniref:PWWP domain-containing protein n=1 Tax=Aphanomyces astaci TaxID=112090 RepID=A0A397EJ89_APHAT|nr:hypothetical protein DYB31_004392 [Aphanomyces astaci]
MCLPTPSKAKRSSFRSQVKKALAEADTYLASSERIRLLPKFTASDMYSLASADRLRVSVAKTQAQRAHREVPRGSHPPPSSKAARPKPPSPTKARAITTTKPSSATKSTASRGAPPIKNDVDSDDSETFEKLLIKHDKALKSKAAKPSVDLIPYNCLAWALLEGYPWLPVFVLDPFTLQADLHLLDKQLAVDSAIRADEAGEARAAAILYRMRLAQRANQATAVERQMVARESSAAIAAHKIQIDAQLQRAAYEQAQLLLVKQQRKAVEVALARRKKAQRQFARHFGQQTVGLMRCHARDRAQDRAVAALDLPVEHVQFAKVAEKKVDESIRAKRTERLVANQRHRVMQSMEIQAALEFQETQERHRLDDIQARVAQERKLKQLLQTEDF